MLAAHSFTRSSAAACVFPLVAGIPSEKQAARLAIIDGLRSYGRDEVAAAIAERMLGEVERWYNWIGYIMEYYDCEGIEDPRCMLRKGA